MGTPPVVMIVPIAAVCEVVETSWVVKLWVWLSDRLGVKLLMMKLVGGWLELPVAIVCACCEFWLGVVVAPPVAPEWPLRSLTTAARCPWSIRLVVIV